MAASLYGRIAAGALLEPLRSRPGTLPERELHRDGVAVDRPRLAAYDRVCGFRLSDTLPATYPHVLAFPLAMEMMAGSDFPFGVLGVIHVAQAIEQRRPLHAGEPLDLRVRAERLAGHPRGRTVDIVAEARAGEELAWRGRSTYLHREPAPDQAPAGSAPARGGDRPAPERGGAHAEWRVPGDVGRRYAAVSGDRNPIHLHPVPARLLGQPGAIAHGMWTVARCLAALEPRLPDAYSVRVAFKLPLVLPATVAFSAWGDTEGRRFAVRAARDGKPHLEGELSPSGAPG